MELLAELLAQDPAAPRLSAYNERTGARLDFSATTLDNWAAKVANMFRDELDLEPGDTVMLDLPSTWQAVAIVLGALAAGVNVKSPDELDDPTEAAVWFVAPEHEQIHEESDVVVVSEDPFGRGVTETGGQLPDGYIDFGPTVRMFGDQFFEPTPHLRELVPTSTWGPAPRVLSTGWNNMEELFAQVLSPIAAGGSAVVVSGLVSAQRLAHIAESEKVTHTASASVS